MRGRERADGLGRLGFDDDVDRAAPRVTLARARPVQRQRQLGDAVQGAAPVVQVRARRAVRLAGQLPRGEVRVLRCPHRTVLAGPRERRAPAPRNARSPRSRSAGRTTSSQAMWWMLTTIRCRSRAEHDQGDLDRSLRTEVDRPAAFPRGDLRGPLLAALRGLPGEVDDTQVEALRRIDDLHGLVAVRDVPRPQNLVACHESLPRPPHGLACRGGRTAAASRSSGTRGSPGRTGAAATSAAGRRTAAVAGHAPPCRCRAGRRPPASRCWIRVSSDIECLLYWTGWSSTSCVFGLGSDEPFDLVGEPGRGGPVEEGTHGHLDAEGVLRLPQQPRRQQRVAAASS